MGDPFVDTYIRERKEKGGTTAGEQSGTKEEEGMFNGGWTVIAFSTLTLCVSTASVLQSTGTHSSRQGWASPVVVIPARTI